MNQCSHILIDFRYTLIGKGYKSERMLLLDDSTAALLFHNMI